MTEQKLIEKKKKEEKNGVTEETMVFDTQKPKEKEFSEEIAKEFERNDEEQIRKELLGETITEFFYQFKQGSRTVTGLSLKGINEIARRMGNIHVMEPSIEEKDDRYDVKVKVKDVFRNIETWGIASQSKKMKLKEGGEMNDDFAMQKAFSKARRNALKQLIPETWYSSLFAEWKKQKEQQNKDARSFMNPPPSN